MIFKREWILLAWCPHLGLFHLSNDLFTCLRTFFPCSWPTCRPQMLRSTISWCFKSLFSDWNTAKKQHKTSLSLFKCSLKWRGYGICVFKSRFFQLQSSQNCIIFWAQAKRWSCGPITGVSTQLYMRIFYEKWEKKGGIFTHKSTFVFMYAFICL